MKSLRLKLSVFIAVFVILTILGQGFSVYRTAKVEMEAESKKIIEINANEIEKLHTMMLEDAEALGKSLHENYDAVIKGQVENALSLIEYHYNAYLNGDVDEEQAMENAKMAVKAVRYGESGYFWIDGVDYSLIAHPIVPQKEGSNRKEAKDPNGVLIIQEIVKVSENGGYVDFMWEKPQNAGSGLLSPKRSYSRLFKPWNWVVSTGNYIDDIEDAYVDHRITSENRFQSDIKAMEKDFLVLMIDSEGHFVYSTNDNYINQTVEIVDYTSNESLNKLFISTNNDFIEYDILDSKSGQVREMLGYVKYDEKSDMHILVSQNKKDVFASVGRLTNVIITTGCAFLVLSIIVSMMFARYFSGPILQLKDVSDHISNGDLTNYVNVSSKDEVGELGTSFNQMIDGLRDMATDSHSISQSLETSSGALQDMINQNAQASEQISTSVEDIAKGASEQVVTTKNGVLSTEELSEKTSVMQTDIEGVRQSVESMRAFSDEGIQVMQELIEKQEINEASVRKINDVIEMLNNQVRAIDEFTDIIISISSQTNLLSLNAEIEAARAGEHGRGFAVVADEIRKLANQTSHSASEIQEVVLAIKKDASEAATLSAEAREITDTQKHAVESTQKVFAKLNTSIEAVVGDLEGVYGSVDDLVEINSSVVEVMNGIHSIAEGTAASTEEIAAFIEEQSASMIETATYVQDLADQAKNLRTSVERYNL